MVTIKRAQYSVLEARLSAPLATIQVLVGPRQVGKTTLIRQVLDAISIQSFSHTADAAKARDAHWIAQHWAVARAYYTHLCVCVGSRSLGIFCAGFFD